jgi:polyisoprenoid-binding protein YceI
MSDQTPANAEDSPTEIGTVRWRLDPSRSAVEFKTGWMWGLVTVGGRFERFEGELDLNEQPAVTLTIEAASLDTGKDKRDTHLRSLDFFDAEHHPEVRFYSGDASLAGETLHVRGQLRAAGRTVPLELDATVRRSDGGLVIEAATEIDQRELGMTWNPLWMVRTPSKLFVRGWLVPDPKPDQ